jgi:hypothetical protein
LLALLLLELLLLELLFELLDALFFDPLELPLDLVGMALSLPAEQTVHALRSSSVGEST